MNSHRSLVRFLIIVALLNAATACIAHPTSPSVVSTELSSAPETVSLVVSQTVCKITSTPPPPDLRLPPRPATLLGGGLLSQNQFTFDLWLYCDPDLSPEGTGALLSEVGGLGVHLAWRYHGPKMTGQPKFFLGFTGNTEPRAVWEGGLAPGTMGSYTGGVRSLDASLTKAVRSGAPISFEIVVTIDNNTYGATLTFSMVSASDGYRPVGIVVSPLRP